MRAATASRVASLSASITRAGLPTAVAPAGTGLTTTAPEPTRAPSPTTKSAQHLRIGADDHTAPQRRVTLRALRQRRAAQRHALVDGAVVADLGGLADDDTHAMVDEHAPADRGAGVDLDAGEEASDVRNESAQPQQPALPAGMRPAVQHQRVQARVAGQRLPAPNARRGRVRGCKSMSSLQAAEHGRFPREWPAECIRVPHSLQTLAVADTPRRDPDIGPMR